MDDDFSLLVNMRPLWVRFDPEDRESPAPDFCLTDTQGQEVCLSDFRGDCSLLIYFARSPEARRTLHDLVSREEEIRQAGARLLVIAPAALADLPVVLWLADADGSTREAYAGLMAPGLTRPDEDLLFVLDEFGGVYAALLGAEKAAKGDASTLAQALSWLEFISIQCPE